MVLDEKRPTLTQRQKDIYEFLKDKILNRGYGPTVREIGNHFGIRSPNGVMCHLKALEKKGLITRESHMSRAIQLAEPPQNRLSLPYAGLLVDGQKIQVGDSSERADFADLFDSEDNCCVRVGVNYPAIHVSEGDTLVVDRGVQSVTGNIVVALDSMGSARVCRDTGDRLECLGADGSLSNSERVLGVVVAVIRRMV